MVGSRAGTIIVRVADASRRHAIAVSASMLVLAAAAGTIAARRVSINTDTSSLISPKLPWRRAAAEMDRAFPQNRDLVVAVIDAATPDQATDAAQRLESDLAADSADFSDVRDPQGSAFFRRNGLLFLDKGQVQSFADSMIAAQPMLGVLSADPSARGLLDALGLFSEGVVRGQIPASELDRPFKAVTAAVNAAAEGRHEPLSWESLISNRKPMGRELRRIILARASLDYTDVEPGRRAIAKLHALAERDQLTPERGVTVRVTGGVALNDDQFSALSEGAGAVAAAAGLLLVLWLALAVRSARAVAAILLTLGAGLAFCACFAVTAVGAFNPISVAFAPLFIGVAIDFGIQFTVRFAAEKLGTEDSPAGAVRRAAAGIGAPLVVAGLATAAAVFSLYPTDYRGVSDLGLIAGAGMLIALILNLTLLPALLASLGAPGFAEAAGLRAAAPLDGWLLRRRRTVLAASCVLAALSLFAIRGLRFDFDPINLENPRAESTRTLFDLMKDPDTSPYTLDDLASSAGEAAALAAKLNQLPEVNHAIWLGSFVPGDQQEKLDILSDAKSILEPAWLAAKPLPPPTPAQVLAAATKCADAVSRVGGAAASQLAAALRRAVAGGPAAAVALEDNLASGAEERLAEVRGVLGAEPVTLGSIPADVRKDWVSADGRYKVEISPKGDPRDQAVLSRFMAAVGRIAPGATGMPLQIRESGRTVVAAFQTATIIALFTVTVLLALVLRSVFGVAAVLAPIVLAGLLTLGTSVVAGIPINFANIIMLPLLLGVGVAFDIYFVLRWKSAEPGLLSSPTARGVVFSALTTGTAFGSLIISKSPGIADMGKLLSLGLLYCLICTLFLLPSFLGTRASKGEGDA
jgi:hypothetical protein